MLISLLIQNSLMAADGRHYQATLRFINLAEDNRVIGIVEHPGKAQGALSCPGPEHCRQRFLLYCCLWQSNASGSAVNEQGEPVAGATVGGLFAR